MSRNAKIFFGSSILLSGGVVWGVHWLQRVESDSMYQGVLRDEARIKEKALKLAAAASVTVTGSTSNIGDNVGAVQQPAPVIDENCETCRISPPPQLLQAQSPEQRRIERQAREAEYENQRALGQKLGAEQGVSVSEGGQRLV